MEDAQTNWTLASVIVPVKDDPRVHDALAALLAGLPLGVEILVADDGDPLRPTSTVLPGVRVVPVHTGNPGAARNAAARLARGDVLLFTDADAVAPAGWIAAALAAFEDPDVDAIAGDSRAPGRGSFARHVDREYERFVRSHASTGYGDLCDARCFGIRRAVFERFGFDPTEPFGEDAALGRRLFEGGVRVRFLPGWFVWHHIRGSRAAEIDRWWTYAAAAEGHRRRTGRDLFRSPGGPEPRGPGASVLAWFHRAPRLAPSAGAALRVASRALASLSALPIGFGSRLYGAARRVAVLSARVHPGAAASPDSSGSSTSTSAVAGAVAGAVVGTAAGASEEPAR